MADPKMGAKLIEAAKKGENSTLQKMLAKDPSLGFFKDSRGYTALHYAAEKGHMNCVEALCTAEPKLTEQQDTMGMTPMHLAAAAGKVRAFEVMLKLGRPNLMIRTANGSTVFDLAQRSPAANKIMPLIGGVNPSAPPMMAPPMPMMPMMGPPMMGTYPMQAPMYTSGMSSPALPYMQPPMQPPMQYPPPHQPNPAGYHPSPPGSGPTPFRGNSSGVSGGSSAQVQQMQAKIDSLMHEVQVLETELASMRALGDPAQMREEISHLREENERLRNGGVGGGSGPSLSTSWSQAQSAENGAAFMMPAMATSQPAGLTDFSVASTVESASASVETCTAKYPYSSQRPDVEIGFEAGEVLTIIYKQPDGWWYARNMMGQQGLVPSNYLAV